jgi:hypothetical protein
MRAAIAGHSSEVPRIMLVAVLLFAISLLAIGEFLLFGALAEAYRNLRQIRESTGLLDTPAPVDLGANRHRSPSECGLPPELDSAVHAVVVYLDKRCGTCNMIVDSLSGGLPRGMWLVLIAPSAAEALSWLSEYGAGQDGDAVRRVVATSADEVERHLGAVVTPLAIEVEGGRLRRAMTVPSTRQFYALVPTTLTLSPRDPEEATAP